MSLLSFNELNGRVRAGNVLARKDGSLIPFDQINSASIDVTLGKFILAEAVPPLGHDILDFRRRDKLTTERIEMDPEEGVVLYPGDFLLAESEEIFNLPNDISGEYKLKSSMARIGLEHLNAGWADAGWHGSVLTLELKNLTRHHRIRIRPGDAIGQMVFFSHEEVPADRSYAARGRYNNDTSVTSAKVAP